MMLPSLHQEVLDVLHGAHQVVRMMTSRATSSMSWPGIMAAITEKWERCSHCNLRALSQPSAPPTASAIKPVYPFQCICANYFLFTGKNYLIIVDRYSNWPEMHQLDGKNGTLIKTLKKLFITFGIPVELAMDRWPVVHSK
jgi:hypothetical protein